MVGTSGSSTTFTLYNTNCTNTDGVSSILKVVDASISLQKVDVFVDKTAIEQSPLVTKSAGSEGFAKGVIRLCIKAQTFLSGTSVSFLKTNVDIFYDLSKNSFQVNNNNVESDTIEETKTTVSTIYGVKVYRCTTTTYTDNEEKPIIKQGELLAICLAPLANSSAAVSISNFEMKFWQGGVAVLPHPAVIGDTGPNESSFSKITSENQIYRVVARLVTKLFDGGSSFNIRGNSYLVFRDDRKLFSSTSKGPRSVQTSTENLAGESTFSMDVKVEKSFKVYENESNNSEIVMYVVGATLALSIGFIIYKKLG